MDKRLLAQLAFLNEIVAVEDTQCAWQLLTRCALPQANYLLRTLPPSLAKSYAGKRDEAVWRACVRVRIMRAEGLPAEKLTFGQRIAQLPARQGGLGLTSAARMSQPAFWASWADSLEMMQIRNPRLTGEIVQLLGADRCEIGCLQELRTCKLALDSACPELPSWNALAAGARPPPPADPDDYEIGGQTHKDTSAARLVPLDSGNAAVSGWARQLHCSAMPAYVSGFYFFIGAISYYYPTTAAMAASA